MYRVKRLNVRVFALLVCACLTSAAFGREAGSAMRSGRGDSAVRVERQAKQMFMQVPPGIPEGSRVRVEFFLNDRSVAEQTKIVHSAAQGLIELLPGAGDFLQRLRDAEAKKPGIVVIRVNSAEKQLQSGSLTQFEIESTSIRARRGRKIASEGACEDDCDLEAQECFTWCDPRGDECQTCHDYWANCLGSCPTCDDWVEVSTTLIGRQFSGTSNILGVQYCNFEEYYLIEETNPAGCYPNRYVCDFDDDTIFYGFGGGHPSQAQCCDDDDNPGDPNYCGGGSSCP